MSDNVLNFLVRIGKMEAETSVRFITLVDRFPESDTPYGIHMTYIHPAKGDWPETLQSSTLGLLSPEELVELRVKLAVTDWKYLIPLREMHTEMISWVTHHQLPREWHDMADARHPATLSKVLVLAKTEEVKNETPPAQLSVQERLRLMRGGVDV